MADETQTLSDLGELAAATGMTPEAEAAAAEPQRDAQGRSYATGKRKDAVDRVWITPGSGKVTANGKDQLVYVARPVLRMLPAHPSLCSPRGHRCDATHSDHG